MSIGAVLFDLDGTLIDTAPDMAASLNQILNEEGLSSLPLQTIRPHVSRGGLALTQLGFGQHRHESEIEPLRLRFLDYYAEHIADHSSLFDGYDEVLDELKQRGIPWGIVTNKPGWLTDPLIEQLNLKHRPAVTVSGDTFAYKKPHPMPLIKAAQHIRIECENCMYVGDDPRDIQAGNAANMTTVIAKYGYITDDSDLVSWQADHHIENAQQILALL